MADNYKESLIQLCKDLKIVEKGYFRLSSGGHSNTYLDVRKLLLHGVGLTQARNGIKKILYNKGIQYDSIGGLAVGAVPLVAAMLVGCDNLHGFYIRQKPKHHGTEQVVEGNIGKQCVILDDVGTTGGSLVKVAKAVAKAGGTVVCAMSVVDREETAYEKMKSMNISYYSLLTMGEII